MNLIMTVPIEALAMVGVDYNEWGLDIGKWEDDDSEWPPPHMLAEEEERDLKHGIQSIGTSSITHTSEDLDGNCDDNGSNGATGECRRHRRVSQGRTTLVEVLERIIQSLRSIKLMVRYMIRLLMIATIVGRKRSVKPS